MHPRRLTPELMDDPALDPVVHRRALRDLERINRISGGAKLFRPAIRELAVRIIDRPIRLLDVACGAGDHLISLNRFARKHKISLELSGCDISDTALLHARENLAAQHVQANLFRHDALRDPSPGEFDLVVCSLFLHHLVTDDVRCVLTAMAAMTKSMVLVNDLARSRLNYVLVWIASRLFSRSPIVHFDGPVSVRAAFTPSELKKLAEEAGLSGAAVTSRFPCRMLLTWRKPT